MTATDPYVPVADQDDRDCTGEWDCWVHPAHQPSTQAEAQRDWWPCVCTRWHRHGTVCPDGGFFT